MPTKLGSLSLLLFTLTACGQTITEPPVTTPEPTTTTASCAAFVDAYTSWATGCRGTTLPAGRRDDLVDHCAARAALPGVEVSAGAIAACAAKITLAECTGVPLECVSPLGRFDNSGQLSYVWMGNSISDTYYDLFPRARGSLAAGAACDIGEQCQSGNCTSLDSCGSCVDESKPGEACGPTALCVGRRNQCTDGVCVEIGLPEGSACQEAKGDSDCLLSLYCSNGTCVPRLKVGDACPEDGYLPVCPTDATCLDAVCQHVEEVHEGEACDIGPVSCTGEGLFCDGKTCRKPRTGAPAGSSCFQDFCAEGLICATYTCAAPKKAGEACEYTESCAAGLACLYGATNSGVCGTPKSEGASCASLEECAKGLHCDQAGPEWTCKVLPELTIECAERYPCSGSEICRAGVCGAFAACSTQLGGQSRREKK